MGSSRPKGFVVPNRDPAQARAALTLARRRRVEIRQQLQTGQLTLTELRAHAHTEKAIRTIRADQLIRALRPQWDPPTRARHCNQLGIAPEQRLGRLGPAQWHRLIGWADSTWPLEPRARQLRQLAENQPTRPDSYTTNAQPLTRDA